jgi:hypothetical protein
VSTASDIREALTVAAGGASAIALALPEPASTVAKITAAALGTAAALIDQGQTPEQIIASLHRARRIDTSVEDAALDALIAAKPIAVTPEPPPGVDHLPPR